MDFKIGDMVQLKSGGPKMTVTGIYTDTVHTSWFIGQKNEKANFNAGALQIFVEEPKK